MLFCARCIKCALAKTQIESRHCVSCCGFRRTIRCDGFESNTITIKLLSLLASKWRKQNSWNLFARDEEALKHMHQILPSILVEINQKEIWIKLRQQQKSQLNQIHLFTIESYEAATRNWSAVLKSSVYEWSIALTIQWVRFMPYVVEFSFLCWKDWNTFCATNFLLNFF